MKPNLATLFFLTMMLGSIPALAENLYIAQNAAGANTGADCANAHTYSWFNTPGNWGAGAGKIGPGDTVHLCGTITAFGSGPFLTFQGSGTAGNPITLRWETGAVLQAATCTDGMIYTGRNSYITIDGGTNGILRTTANGTSPTYANHNSCDGITFGARGSEITPGGSHVILNNLEIGPMYVRTTIADQAGQGSGIYGFFGSGDQDVQVYNNRMHDAEFCLAVGFMSGTLTDVYVYNNTVYNCATGIVFASGSNNSHASNVLLHDNHVSDGYVWDSTNNRYHCDGFHIWANDSSGVTASGITGLKIYNNTIDGKWGTYTTSRIYVEALDNDLPAIINPLIFNNIVNNSAPGTVEPTDGYIYTKGTSNAQVYNNTVIGMGGTSNQDSAFNTLWLITPTVHENNIVVNCNTVYYAESGNTWGTRDYNVYYNIRGGASKIGTHDVLTDPKLDASFRLQSGSSAIGAGVNLSSYFTTDKSNNPRLATGAWDVGAYVYTTSPPPPPTNVRALVY